jgi:phosphopentomutase
MARPFDRITVIVLDGVGIGALPDAAQFGEDDPNSNTLLHIHEKFPLQVPQMAKIGLSCLLPLATKAVSGGWGIMREQSPGKDTTTGHWEIAGIVLPQPFPTYPHGFPDEVIKPFCERIGRGILANYPASGTEIIQKLGDEHVATGKPIVYTSADSVFQIAAHEDVIPLPELYRICQIAREILCGKHAVGRVIARPFAGKSGNYERTRARHDFSLLPLAPTVLDLLKKKKLTSIGVGKIGDIFAEQGLTESYPVKGNEACMQSTLELLQKKNKGLLFVNLVDFDMLYGHRNDPKGFRDALEAFDKQMPDLLERMHDKDLLILTADHGNDPTTPSTDHSREYVPLLVYHKRMQRLIPLGERSSFADIGKTVADNFGLSGKCIHGTSFLPQIV